MARHLHPQVTGERQDRRPLGLRVDAHEHDRVAALTEVRALRVGGAGPRRIGVDTGVAVVADDQEVLRRRIGGRERHVRVADEHAVRVDRLTVGADDGRLRRGTHVLTHPLADQETDRAGEAGHDDHDVEDEDRPLPTGVTPRPQRHVRLELGDVGLGLDLVRANIAGRVVLVVDAWLGARRAHRFEQGSDIAGQRYWRVGAGVRHPRRASAHVDEVDDEDERLTTLDHATAPRLPYPR